MSDWGIKISKEGYDVTDSATTLNKLIFSSAYNNWKVYAEGTTTISLTTNADGTGNTGSVTISHGLGYVPAIEAFVQISGSWVRIPTYQLSLNDDVFDAYINSTQLVIEGFPGFDTPASTTLTFSVKYVIFYEQVN